MRTLSCRGSVTAINSQEELCRSRSKKMETVMVQIGSICNATHHKWAFLRYRWKQDLRFHNSMARLAPRDNPFLPKRRRNVYLFAASSQKKALKRCVALSDRTCHYAESNRTDQAVSHGINQTCRRYKKGVAINEEIQKERPVTSPRYRSWRINGFARPSSG